LRQERSSKLLKETWSDFHKILCLIKEVKTMHERAIEVKLQKLPEDLGGRF